MANKRGAVQEPEVTYRRARPYKLLIYTGNDLHISLFGAVGEKFSFGYHSAQLKATGELLLQGSAESTSISFFSYP